MYFILSVAGCLPFVNLEINEDGYGLVFQSKKEAETYAKENCAWEWKVVEF